MSIFLNVIEEDFLGLVKVDLKVFDEPSLAVIRSTGLLRTLIERLLVNHVVSHIHPPEDLLKEAYSDFVDEKNLNDPIFLSKYLDSQSMSIEDLLHQISLPLRVIKYSLDSFGNKAEAHFLKRKQDLDQYTYSLLRLENSDLVNELYLQIDSKEDDFGRLASQFSEGPEKQTNGFIGPTSLIHTHERIRETLISAEQGILQEPFLVGKWWVLLRLECRDPVKYDNQIHQQMAIELFDLWIENECTSIIINLPSTTKVVKNMTFGEIS